MGIELGALCGLLNNSGMKSRCPGAMLVRREGDSAISACSSCLRTFAPKVPEISFGNGGICGGVRMLELDGVIGDRWMEVPTASS